MTGPLFHVSAVLDAAAPELRLLGELDYDGTAVLRAALADCFARLPDRIVLDLRGLSFCDCAGLNVLLEAKATADLTGTDLGVEGVHAQVARLFALAGVTAMFADRVPRVRPGNA